MLFWFILIVAVDVIGEIVIRSAVDAGGEGDRGKVAVNCWNLVVGLVICRLASNFLEQGEEAWMCNLLYLYGAVLLLIGVFFVPYRIYDKVTEILYYIKLKNENISSGSVDGQKSGSVVYNNNSPSQTSNHSEKIPAWKRVQMEQESGEN